ncbi:MAG TPA: hypothetical protein VG122_01915 [Gemmata sp.]|jgi:hypothetical protein|nr:hypothetical protein [Gemmata sp.]
MFNRVAGNRPSFAPEIRIDTHLEETYEVPLSPVPAIAAEVASLRCWERLAWYTGSILLCCVLVFYGFRLDQADLNCPFTIAGDSLLILPMVKSTVERGFGGHWRNERLGAPGILEMHDFPVIDHLHFFLIWLLSKVVSNLGLLYNLYYLLTYPLTTFTAMLAFRHLRLSIPAAAVGGLLYAFLPYHYLRWEDHYFLSAYWFVPLSLLPVLAICRGEFPFYRKHSDGIYQRRLLSWGSMHMITLALVIASAGAYYAFFTCAFLSFAGVYGTVMFRRWQAAASAAGLIAFIVAFGVINHAPSIVYQKQYGWNPVTVRFSKEADIYGLKIAHLILPIDDHNLSCLARIKGCYNSAFRREENENKTASLGIVGSVGLIGLVCSLLLPFRSGWPYRPVAGLTIFAVLLGSLGGFGSVFNLLVIADIRAYNRISVFIAFFCIFATLWAIDRFVHPIGATLAGRNRSPTGQLDRAHHSDTESEEVSGVRPETDRLRDRVQARSVSLKWLIWSAVFLVGFFDQTPSSWFKSKIIKRLDTEAKRYRSDGRFFAEIERNMPRHSKIFCLPFIQYPESVNRVMAYEHARGYLHTDTLCWSYGAMKWRETDAWQLDVAFKDTEEFLKRIVYRGFDGLFIDKKGYSAADEKINAINKEYANLVEQRCPGTRNARLPEIVHEDGKQLFLDLRPYREELRSANLVVFDAKEKEEREWVAVIWLKGFWSSDPPDEKNPLRWGPADGNVVIINPSDRVRKFQISMTFHPNTLGIFRMQLSGLVDDDFNLNSNSLGKKVVEVGVEKKYEIEVKPGRDVLHIHCTPPPNYYFPEDNRSLCYHLKDFKIKELR